MPDFSVFRRLWGQEGRGVGVEGMVDDIEAGSTRIKNGQVGRDRDRDGDGGREGGEKGQV